LRGSLPPLEDVTDEPEHRRPQPDEEGAALSISSFVLIYGLRPDPQAYAQNDRAERGELHVPAAQAGLMDAIDQHGARLPPRSEINQHRG
jgi:hypothetical protein